jgi:hypothetical protein
MTTVSDVLPIVAPFFGAVLIISYASTRCFWRRTQRDLNALMGRVVALEARATAPVQTTATVLPVYNLPQAYGRPSYYPGPQTSYPLPSAPPAMPNSVNL